MPKLNDKTLLLSDVPRCEDTGLGISLVPEAGIECSVGVGSTAGLQ
jgi:hypothetical protein